MLIYFRQKEKKISDEMTMQRFCEDFGDGWSEVVWS